MLGFRYRGKRVIYGLWLEVISSRSIVDVSAPAKVKVPDAKVRSRKLPRLSVGTYTSEIRNDERS